MLEPILKRTVERVAEFYETYKVGHVGFQGYRKTSDLTKLSRCVYTLLDMGIIDPKKTIFMDLGCRDGSVNLLLSYFVRKSIGIEIDEDILCEHKILQKKLNRILEEKRLLLPPANVCLHRGNSLKNMTFESIYDNTGVRFFDVDIFYAHITLHDLFAEKIAKEAKRGAYFMLYGFSKVLPNYQGLKLITNDGILEGTVTIYRKQ